MRNLEEGIKTFEEIRTSFFKRFITTTPTEEAREALEAIKVYSKTHRIAEINNTFSHYMRAADLGNQACVYLYRKKIGAEILKAIFAGTEMPKNDNIKGWMDRVQ